MKLAIRITIVLLVMGVGAWAVPPQAPRSPQATSAKPAATAPNSMSDDDMRLEGEKRFRTNCGRCHQPPHKFPPRMMATIIRHMRVRSMITEEDMKYILRYMTQ